jgi:RNA polymerase sigma factor (sigma-70 family)
MLYAELLTAPDFQNRLARIAGRYGSEADEVKSFVTVRLLSHLARPGVEAALTGPEHAFKYLVKRAAWEARHYGRAARTYNRFVAGEDESEMRSAYGVPEGEAFDFDEYVAGSEASPEAEVEARETRRALAAAIERLPEDKRQVMRLLAEGYASHEIARKLGKSTGAICQTIKRLRPALAVAL